MLGDADHFEAGGELGLADRSEHLGRKAQLVPQRLPSAQLGHAGGDDRAGDSEGPDRELLPVAARAEEASGPFRAVVVGDRSWFAGGSTALAPMARTAPTVESPTIPRCGNRSAASWASSAEPAQTSPGARNSQIRAVSAGVSPEISRIIRLMGKTAQAGMIHPGRALAMRIVDKITIFAPLSEMICS